MRHHLVVVNLSDDKADGRIRLGPASAAPIVLTDVLTGERYLRDGAAVASDGLYVRAGPAGRPRPGLVARRVERAPDRRALGQAATRMSADSGRKISTSRSVSRRAQAGRSPSKRSSRTTSSIVSNITSAVRRSPFRVSSTMSPSSQVLGGVLVHGASFPLGPCWPISIFHDGDPTRLKAAWSPLGDLRAWCSRRTTAHMRVAIIGS